MFGYFYGRYCQVKLHILQNLLMRFLDFFYCGGEGSDVYGYQPFNIENYLKHSKYH